MRDHSPITIAKAILTLAVCAAAMSAHSQVYKCKDTTGKILYSGKPCEYGGDPLGISNNVIQGETSKADAGARQIGNYASDADSQKCTQLLDDIHALTERKDVSITGQYDIRGQRNALEREFKLRCGSGRQSNLTAQEKPEEIRQKCAQLLEDIHALTESKDRSITGQYDIRSRRNALEREYKLRCS